MLESTGSGSAKPHVARVISSLRSNGITPTLDQPLRYACPEGTGCNPTPRAFPRRPAEGRRSRHRRAQGIHRRARHDRRGPRQAERPADSPPTSAPGPPPPPPRSRRWTSRPGRSGRRRSPAEPPDRATPTSRRRRPQRDRTAEERGERGGSPATRTPATACRARVLRPARPRRTWTRSRAGYRPQTARRLADERDRERLQRSARIGDAFHPVRLDEGIDHDRVELDAGELAQFGERLFRVNGVVRYGRLAVMASNASATCRMRASFGISSPMSRSG